MMDQPVVAEEVSVAVLEANTVPENKVSLILCDLAGVEASKFKDVLDGDILDLRDIGRINWYTSEFTNTGGPWVLVAIEIRHASEYFSALLTGYNHPDCFLYIRGGDKPTAVTLKVGADFSFDEADHRKKLFAAAKSAVCPTQ